ncbi:MAG TPA: protein phosphatase 2C domain-containing protein [Gemmatimonadaceae bacterium]|jgi:protein phosphatase
MLTAKPVSDPMIATPPKPRDDEIDVCGLTHQGKVRPSNQDHFLLASLHKLMRVRSTSLPNPELLEIPGERLATLIMVADGVGGANAGEEASRAALESIAAYVTETMQCYYRADPSDGKAFEDALRAGAAACHTAVVEKASGNPELRGMATTLTLGLAVWPSLYLLQIGDSRAYQLRDGKLARLTRDQTLAQDLVDTGVLKPSDLARSPLSHVLTSAIGAEWRPAVSKVALNRTTTILLCTDGLTKHVPDEKIEDRLKSLRTSEEVCKTLLNDALEAGGSDNITVLCGRVRESRAPEET